MKTAKLPPSIDRVKTIIDLERDYWTPLEKEQSELLLKLMIAANNIGDISVLESATKGGQHAQLLNDFGMSGRLVAKRLNALGIDDRVSVFVVLCVVLLGRSSPASLVIWVHSLQKYLEKTDAEIIDLGVLFERIIPFGVPTADGMKALWEAQKIDGREFGFNGDNALDYILETAFK